MNIYDLRFRAYLWQGLTLLAVVGLIGAAAFNAVASLKRTQIKSGFAFLEEPASFDISQSLISYEASDTVLRAFGVGLLNTLLVAVLGVIFATLLGFLIGIGRLSSNWIASRLSAGYVEVVRNVPLLLQLFIWYKVAMEPLPEPTNSIGLGPGIYLNNQGMILPNPTFQDGSLWVAVAVLLGIAGAVGYGRYARQRQDRTGKQSPVALVGVAIIVGLPLLAYVAAGAPVSFELASKSRFGLSGGLQIAPEFVALLFGLVIYTAAFIAEIVRAGILAVSKGQTEAADALGLRRSHTLRLVVIPQALRVIIPPLTSQYLNLTKNSSLAVAIGYPDIVHVGNSVLNLKNQAVEVIMIWMAVYLTISLATAGFMNWYNKRIALVER